jgi:glycerol kinase
MFDIHKGQWDDELLEVLNVPRSVLPRVARTAEIFGETVEGALPAGIPIAAMAGDQHAALFGQRCVRRGMVKTTYGTGSFIVMHTGREAIESRHQLLSTVAWQRDTIEYALEGSVFVGGAAVQWLRDGLGIIESSGEIEALAASVPDSGGVVFVPAFTGLGAPHWDPTARGALFGISRGTTRAHMARATLEAMAAQVAEVVEAMQSDAGAPVVEMRVDGGASVNSLLLQMQADLLGVPVVRSASPEATALGVAWLAGVSIGLWSDGDVNAMWQHERTFEPAITATERESKMSAWKDAVERTKGWGD